MIISSELWNESIKYDSLNSLELEDCKNIENMLLDIFKTQNKENYGTGYNIREITTSANEHDMGGDIFNALLSKVLSVMLKNNIIECNDIDSSQKCYRLRNTYKYTINCSTCNKTSIIDVPLRDKDSLSDILCPNCNTRTN